MKKCPQCNAENASYARFCIACGYAFAVTSENLAPPARTPAHPAPAPAPERPESVPTFAPPSQQPLAQSAPSASSFAPANSPAPSTEQNFAQSAPSALSFAPTQSPVPFSQEQSFAQSASPVPSFAPTQSPVPFSQEQSFAQSAPSAPPFAPMHSPAPSSKQTSVPAPAPVPPTETTAGRQPLPVLIENNSPMTKQTLRDVYQFKKAGLLLLAVGALFFLVWLLPTVFLDKNDSFILILAIIYMALGIFFVYYEKNILKNSKLFTDNSYQIYQFDERGIRATSFDGNVQTGESYLTYDKITNIRQRKQFIFIRLGTVFWIVNRNTFTYGTEYDLKNLLLAKCPPKTVRFPKK